MWNLLLWMLALQSAPSEAAPQAPYTFSDKDFVFALEVNKRPSADTEGSLCDVKSLTVRRKSDGQELQKMVLEDILLDCYLEPGRMLVVEDINFDGRNDIRVLSMLDARLQSTFQYWLYDKKTGRFERAARFEGLTSPSFDAKTRTVTSVLRVGAANKTVEKFQVRKDGTLELLYREETTQSWQDGTTSVTVGKKVRGKWQEETRPLDE
jgi:hypothetical protein